MKENPSITRKEISEKLDLSESAIQRRITYLTNNGILARIGGKYSGTWKVLKEML
jgi:HTH domain